MAKQVYEDEAGIPRFRNPLQTHFTDLKYRCAYSDGGYFFDEMRSLLQKAIRRGDFQLAAFAAIEMWRTWAPQFTGRRSNLLNRLLVIAVEDVGPQQPTLFRTIVKLVGTNPKNRGGVTLTKVLGAVYVLSKARKSRVTDDLCHYAMKGLVETKQGRLVLDPTVRLYGSLWVPCKKGRVCATTWTEQVLNERTMQFEEETITIKRRRKDSALLTNYMTQFVRAKRGSLYGHHEANRDSARADMCYYAGEILNECAKGNVKRPSGGAGISEHGIHAVWQVLIAALNSTATRRADPRLSTVNALHRLFHGFGTKPCRRLPLVQAILVCTRKDQFMLRATSDRTLIRNCAAVPATAFATAMRHDKISMSPEIKAYVLDVHTYRGRVLLKRGMRHFQTVAALLENASSWNPYHNLAVQSDFLREDANNKKRPASIVRTKAHERALAPRRTKRVKR